LASIFKAFARLQAPRVYRYFVARPNITRNSILQKFDGYDFTIINLPLSGINNFYPEIDFIAASDQKLDLNYFSLFTCKANIDVRRLWNVFDSNKRARNGMLLLTSWPIKTFSHSLRWFAFCGILFRVVKLNSSPVLCKSFAMQTSPLFGKLALVRG